MTRLEPGREITDIYGNRKIVPWGGLCSHTWIESDESNHYLFECPKCGATKEVQPKCIIYREAMGRVYKVTKRVVSSNKR